MSVTIKALTHSCVGLPLPFQRMKATEDIMKSKGFAFIPVMIILGAVLAGSAAYFISKKNDSPVEQAAEAILKTEGIDIDFSPEDDTE